MKLRFAAFAGLVLVSGCVNMQDWYAAPARPPTIPTETSFTVLDPAPGRGGNLFLTLRLEDGEDPVFLVDTGAPVTVLDFSLRSRLGRPIGSGGMFHPYYGRRQTSRVYRAPKLYLGDAQLLTGRWVATEDLIAIVPNSPVRGVLGMDCLRHYCMQLDFVENKVRFLDPDSLPAESLGRGFPLTFSSGPLRVAVNAGFFDSTHTVIDTGIYWDGSMRSNVLQQAVQQQKATWTEPVKASATHTNYRAHFRTATFGSETYSDLLINTLFEDSIGLRLLGRHLVTLNFPKRTMYLLRRTAEPLPEGAAHCPAQRRSLPGSK